VRLTGDLTMTDGTTLRYTVVRPAGAQKLPTLFEYSGYDPGTNPDATYIKQYVESGAGYNYIGVSLRGAGCSSGTFDFFQPAEAKDGAAVIAWIRKQPWSNGKVGMIGKSYPGITQLFVAAENPPGLLAIAPGHFFADAYRDVGRPGGIQNYGFASLWSFVAQPYYGLASNPRSCPQRIPPSIQGLPTNPFVQLQSHLYDDALYKERSPGPKLSRIRASILATESWQDEQLASRGTDLLAQLDDLKRTNWWLDVTNGDHGMMRTATGYADLRAYYDYTLKGSNNGWAKRPRVKVWWDSTVAGRVPTWVTGMQHWSEKQRAARGERPRADLWLRPGRRVTRHRQSRVRRSGWPTRCVSVVPEAAAELVAAVDDRSVEGRPHAARVGIAGPVAVIDRARHRPAGDAVRGSAGWQGDVPPEGLAEGVAAQARPGAIHRATAVPDAPREGRPAPHPWYAGRGPRGGLSLRGPDPQGLRDPGVDRGTDGAARAVGLRRVPGAGRQHRALGQGAPVSTGAPGCAQ